MQPPAQKIHAMGETWSASTEAALQETTGDAASPPIRSQHGGGVLRRGLDRFASASAQTQARIGAEIAQLAARRLGTIAILTAVTVVGVGILQDALQPEMAAAQRTPLYRLSALFLVLAAIGLAVLERARLVSPQKLLDLGLVFECGGSLAIALVENSVPWPNSAVLGTTAVQGWIAICVVLIPNRPWKSITAAIGSALMPPCAHLLAAHVLGYPVLPWNRLASYALGPVLIVAWAPFITTRIHRMQQDLSRAQEMGSYGLKELLGRGGMGEVWLARHRFLRRDAAVKLVRPALLQRIGASERARLQRRFEREAQAIASLSSPHTVAVYDFGLAENGSLYYAMEFLHGLDAEALVEGYGAQPAGRVISFLRQACESLEEAHDAGLVHRDVKPGNLFICRLGKRADFVKLLDFGLVRTLADTQQTRLTIHNETSGTPAFMAPEQVRGDPIDGRADIYGLGCVAYFLLTGAFVFNKGDAIATALAHVEERPEPPSSRSELPIPESLERVVMACLEKIPERRPQSAAELVAKLDACTDIAPWTQKDADRWWTLHRPEPVRRAS